MRTISAALLAHLQGVTLTIAYCVSITRRDGVVLGFTTAADPVVFGGITYTPSASFQASALKQSAGGNVDNLDVLGILDSGSITDADLRAGRYDGARVAMELVNYEDVAAGSMTLLTATIGNITINDGSYVAELRSLTQAAAQYVGDVTSATCRVRQLGDAQCKLALGPYTWTGTVSAVSADGLTLSCSANTQVTGYYDYGTVTMTSGVSNGLSREVKTSTQSGGMQILLHEPVALGVSVGDGIQLIAGCDRSWTTCINKFANSVNYQGDPLLPGNDQIMIVGRHS